MIHVSPKYFVHTRLKQNNTVLSYVFYRRINVHCTVIYQGKKRSVKSKTWLLLSVGMSGAAENADILSVADVVKDRWKVVSAAVNCWTWREITLLFGHLKIITPQSSGEEDRWRGLRGGLWSFGSVEPVHGCLKGRVRSTSQTSAQDGGGCVEETSGWVMLTIHPLVCIFLRFGEAFLSCICWLCTE